ncbi:MAG: YcjX family protein [Pseudomonadota bacterium]
MVIGRIADGLTRGVEATVSTVSEAFFEPVVRLGVTGLSRAGKTVFITSLVANLLDRGRMQGLVGASEGTIRAAYLQPQPDNTIPRFDYETHLAALKSETPHWPESTRSVSELRLSFRVQPKGLLAGLSGIRTLHVDIVDYPGEWLLDLSLLETDFSAWSKKTLDRARARTEAERFLAVLETVDPNARTDEPTARSLADSFTEYLTAARGAGYADCTPGRFLLPGELAGSPVLTFAPVPPGRTGRGSLAREFERRFEAYKREVVRPFFRDHFARIDRQVVLVDMLEAIAAGPAAVEDLREAMADILAAFRPGRNVFLTELLRGRRVERILFAATKADHLHHTQHGRLTTIAEAVLADAKSRAEFAGAETKALAIASLRATTEDRMRHGGDEIDVVRGILASTGKPAAFHPGSLPEDPATLLTPAAQSADAWPLGDYGSMRFAPQPFTSRPGEGPPHIRLDKAAEYLIGDRLR